VIRAIDVVIGGGPSGGSAVTGDFVALGFDDRHRRRLAIVTARGERVLLDLPAAVAIPGGARLVLEDGRQLEVRAAPEPLTEVRASDPHHLARLAWHLGNRHVAAAIAGGRILIRRDHVLAEMLRGLGAEVADLLAPFDPEAGAYAHGAPQHRHTAEPAHTGSHHHHERDEAGDNGGGADGDGGGGGE
jgi:urease accessory protein